jgi:hypothetical protein
MTDHKLLSKELYEMLERVSDFIDFERVPLPLMEELDNLNQKYEEATTRGTGRTTALYMKAIAESLANPGKSIEFEDHCPHTRASARLHGDKLVGIIQQLEYKIVVRVPAGGGRVYLYNGFVK